MTLPNFIPLEHNGMSVITAIVLFFLMSGASVYFWWDKREITRLDTRMDKHQIK